MRQRILTTCGNASCTYDGHKHVDPARLVYNGCFVIYTGDNSHLENLVPRGNGTRCEIIEVKLKHRAETTIKNYYGKKVRTVLADQVEYLKLKEIDEPKEMSEIKHAIIRQRSIADKFKSSERNTRIAENNIINLENRQTNLNSFKYLLLNQKKKHPCESETITLQ